MKILKQRLSLTEPAHVALQTIRAHKLRTFLTLLGVILSVSTLIVVVSLIEGTNRYIAERVANLGSNVFLVNRFPIITNAADFAKAVRRNRYITWDDFVALRDGLRLPINVGVEARSFAKTSAGRNSLEDVSVRGVTANREHLRRSVEHSIGIVTALNPYIGYENATAVAKEAHATGQSVYDLVLAKGLLTQAQLDDILRPEILTQPRPLPGRE